ncbi:hypothetical protein ABT160_23480 [Streptomyces sp. NPDC001941]|uniref:VG15 protein n=1 Tax=Streptomyces sp. NPDC001941 TaxID=3154659 RepID=UPI00331F0126
MSQTRAQALTELHAKAQAKLTGNALRRLNAAWARTRVGDARSVAQFFRYAEGVIADSFVMSGEASARYYQEHRRALLGEALFQSAEDAYAQARRLESASAQSRAGKLSARAQRYVRDLRAAGVPEAQIRRLVGSRVLGEASRLVQMGGRDALAYFINSDPKVLGYQRRASAKCCAFCAMLASRPNLYKTARSAGAGASVGGRTFKAGPTAVGGPEAAPWHNNCRCVAVPVYSRTQRPPRNSAKYKRMWDRGEIEIRVSADGTSYPVFKPKESGA